MKSALFLSFIVLSLFSFAQCSTSSMAKRSDYEPSRSTAVAEERGLENDQTSTQGPRIILMSGYLTLIVDDPEKDSQKVASLAKKYGGYVQTSGNYSVILRVEANRLEEAMKEIASYGNVEDRQIRGDDVTDQYYDSKIRLENKVKARERYLELLKKAENVTAAVGVEKELERLNGEIESLKGQINRLEHLSTYSTINVTIEKRIRPGPLGYVFAGVFYAVKWLFVWD